MKTPGDAYRHTGHIGKNKLSAAASLQDREYPQNEEEQVEHSQEKRNG